MLASAVPPPVRVFFANHNSSNLDPKFISDYILAEQKIGRYSEGYHPKDLERIIGPFYTAPLGLTPKPHTDTFRLIEDLSYPRNDPLIPSINSRINSDDFPTAWGTFDEAAALVLSLPPGAKAATFDISAAYRLTPIHPDQQHALCIHTGMVWCMSIGQSCLGWHQVQASSDPSQICSLPSTSVRAFSPSSNGWTIFWSFASLEIVGPRRIL